LKLDGASGYGWLRSWTSPGCRRSARAGARASGYGARCCRWFAARQIPEQDLRESQDRVHGRANLVRHVGQKYALGLARAPDVVDQRPLADTSRKILTMPWNSPLPSTEGQSSCDGDLLSVPVNARHLVRSAAAGSARFPQMGNLVLQMGSPSAPSSWKNLAAQLPIASCAV